MDNSDQLEQSPLDSGQLWTDLVLAGQVVVGQVVVEVWKLVTAVELLSPTDFDVVVSFHDSQMILQNMKQLTNVNKYQ